MADQDEEHDDAYARQSTARSATAAASTRLKAAQAQLKKIKDLHQGLAGNLTEIFLLADPENSDRGEVERALEMLEPRTTASLTKLPTQLDLVGDELTELQRNLRDLQLALEQPFFSPTPVVAARPTTTAADSTLSQALASLNERELGRMASIRSSLQLSSNEEVLESCVAVQNYFTAKVADGWKIFLERKRERREVVLRSIGRE